MPLLRFLLVALSCLPLAAAAQGTPLGKQPRILLLLDGSSSMLQSWQGKSETRFAAAARLIDVLMDSVYDVNRDVEFALRVYGHEHGVPENNCFDTRREVIFSKNNRAQMELRLASLHPLGVSPIAYSLKQAAENDLEAEDRYSYSIILITDGGESCGGDLCAVAQELASRNIFFKPYILSLVDYAPLAQQYACLGQYLTVTTPAAVRTAVGTIVASYRPALTGLPVVKARPQPAAPVLTSVPSVLNIPVPPVTLPSRDSLPLARLPLAPGSRTLPVRFTVSTIRVRSIPRFPLPRPLPDADELPRLLYVLRTRPAPQPPQPVARVRTLRVPTFPLPQPEPEPVARTAVGLLAVGPVRPLPASVMRVPAPARPRPVPRFPLPVPERAAPEPPMPRLEPVERWFVYRPMTAPVRTARARPVPRFPLPKREEDPAPVAAAPVSTPAPVPVAAAPTPKPAPTSAPKPGGVITRTVDLPGVKAADYTTASEPAAEASVAVYFTDGRGKFYPSTPQLQLLDPKTGALVKKFHRTVDPSGNPDPQAVPPGTYNILVAGRSNLMAAKVTIGAGEKKKVTITVTNGALRFAYLGNPKRPVAEFSATVVRRFADDRGQMTQKCTQELPYEPGNYYVEINTVPVTRRNLDIDFGGTTQVDIAEPGWVQFTNATPLDSKVVLFQPIGDGYASFLKFDVTGAQADQKIRLQPGTYEARWVKGANGPQPAAAVQKFVVKPNATAAVELQ